MATPLRPGRRICVVGTSGSGKTYVAEALARLLDMPYVCNDAIIWRPNWQPAPEEKAFADLERATANSSWTFDGNLGGSPGEDLALQRCDTVVWLDLPRLQVHTQVLLRSLRRVITRASLWHDNRERMRRLLSRDSIVLWSFRTFNKRRRQYEALFSDQSQASKRRIRLRSRAEVNQWLAAVENKEAAPSGHTS